MAAGFGWLGLALGLVWIQPTLDDGGHDNHAALTVDGGWMALSPG